LRTLSLAPLGQRLGDLDLLRTMNFMLVLNDATRSVVTQLERTFSRAATSAARFSGELIAILLSPFDGGQIDGLGQTD
jgi:hypothetical protein